MKKTLWKFSFILILLALLTGCPKPNDGITDEENNEDPPKTELSLTQKIAAATTSIDFENAEIEEDAVISKTLVVKNLNLNGKKLTLEASGIELQNIQNA